MSLLHIVLFAALFATGFAEVVELLSCEEGSDDICKVTEVRITPCENKENCDIRKGTNASISFDFTPNFAVSNLKTLVFWANGKLDLAFDGFGSDNGCDYTTCPTEAGKSQTLDYNLHVGRRLPKGTYMLKWKLWNEDDEKQVCCFKAQVTLLQSPKKKVK